MTSVVVAASGIEHSCPLLRNARPAARADPAEAITDCPIAGAVRDAFAKSRSISDDELVKLRASVELAVAEHPRSCAIALGRMLDETTECGIVFDAVAIRVLNGKNVDEALVAAQVLRPTACQWKLISALREAERATPATVAAVASLTRSADESARNPAWLTLGTLERVARRAQQSEMVSCIDDALANALHSSTHAERSILTNAAGNAGCEKCRDVITKDLVGGDAPARRDSVAALRFLESATDVETMCNTLHADTDAGVRATAAYALRHNKTFLEERLKCLFQAATTDETTSVSTDAVNSISELSTDSQLGVGTLVQVVRHAQSDSTRKQALTALRGFASDDAIRTVLSSP